MVLIVDSLYSLSMGPGDGAGWRWCWVLYCTGSVSYSLNGNLGFWLLSLGEVSCCLPPLVVYVLRDGDGQRASHSDAIWPDGQLKRFL